MDATTIFFLTALDCYAEHAHHRPDKNAMRVAMELFRSIVSNPLLRNTDIVLLLNKHDVFRKLVASGKYPMEAAFPDFLDVRVRGVERRANAHSSSSISIGEPSRRTGTLRRVARPASSVTRTATSATASKLFIVLRQSDTPERFRPSR